jgi:DNA-binding HxlR family transcriptional regulator
MRDFLDYGTANCSLRRTLDLVGEKWTLQIIRDAANGVRRFDDLHRHVGASASVLSDRLRTLVEHGVLETRTYREPGRRTRREYRLTDRGWALLPALVALMQWGDEYLADADGPPLQVRHRECGHDVRAVVVCTHDGCTHNGEHLTHHDTETVPGPGARKVTA